MGSALVFSSSCSIFCKLCHYPNLFLGSSKLGSFCYKKHNNSYYPISPPCLKFNDVITNSKLFMNGFPKNKRKVVLCLSDSQITDANSSEVGNDKEEEQQQSGENLNRELIEENETYIPFKVEKENEKLGIIAACFVGLLTGVAVVLFNNTVHDLRDFFWDDIPSRGASWLRERPIEETWIRVISVPTCGGIIVAMLNGIRGALDNTPSQSKGFLAPSDNVKAAFRPVLKAFAASITLGSGNSLGPEGPSVEIGASVAKGISTVFGFSNQSRTSIVAAGSAAGIASGFNAAVAGCFFAVESVLWPSPAADSAPTLTNTTSMVILSAVIASIISEVGLGSQPAFKVPEYDFRSPSELPLYLVLGILCGLVSLTLSRCTSYAITVVDKSHKVIGIPKTVFPILGGLSVGLIALAYPEILYWGFENVNLLLESKPFVKGLSAELLLQLVGVKIITTSLCRASGLVGGYYAPSLFIGASTGMAYGKFASYAISNSDPFFHLSILEVASPQAYGLVGMAATLAGVCQVPLTAVLLLFELTQDYRIVLPLLGAVGLSSWIASGQVIKRDSGSKDVNLESKTKSNPQISRSSFNSSGLSSNSSLPKTTSNSEELCELESSLCLDDSVTEFSALEERIFVSQAMRIRFITVLMSTFLTEAVTLMFAEKQSCAMIVDDENALIGFLTLDDIQEFSELAKARYGQDEVEKLTVFEMCNSSEGKCRVLWTTTPDMNLCSAQNIMKAIGVSQIPVVSDHEDHRRNLVGLLDKECIDLTCRVVATQEALSLSSKLEKK